jgi:hypothetical protein
LSFFFPSETSSSFPRLYFFFSFKTASAVVDLRANCISTHISAVVFG